MIDQVGSVSLGCKEQASASVAQDPDTLMTKY